MAERFGIEEGIYLEYRTIRLFNEMGYFSRRSIPLKHYFYPESIDITDIDAYGIRWNYDFSNDIIIAQCKSGRSKTERKSGNPILWLSGLKQLLQADRAYLIKSIISSKLLDFAINNGIIPIDVVRLNELEEQLNLSDWKSSYDITNYKRKIDYYKKIKTRSNYVQDHYWFLVSDYWGVKTNLQIKRIINYVEKLLQNLTSIEHNWLLIESVILFSVSLINFCHEVSPYKKEDRENYIKISMIEGIGNIEDQEKILKITKSLISAYIKEYTGESVQYNSDDVKIPPPEYTDKLIELLTRLVDKPKLSIKIPHFLDYYLYESQINGKDVEKLELEKKYSCTSIELDILVKLSKNIIRFLDANADQRDIFKKLMAF